MRAAPAAMPSARGCRSVLPPAGARAAGTQDRRGATASVLVAASALGADRGRAASCVARGGLCRDAVGCA
jgi:hypothetical protein